MRRLNSTHAVTFLLLLACGACGASQSSGAAPAPTVPAEDEAAANPEAGHEPESANSPAAPSESERGASPGKALNETKAQQRPEYKDLNLAGANNAFALDLYRHLAKMKSGNVAVSPVSISIALAMTSMGAVGTTKTEMDSTLRLSDMNQASNAAQEYASLLKSFKKLNSDGNEFKIANRLFGNKDSSFEAPFLRTLDQNFQAPVEKVNFAQPDVARAKINSWVDVQTDKKIHELLAPGVINPLTRLVLVNAIYLKAQWQHAFEPSHTRSESFEVTTQERKTLPMMHTEGAFAFAEDAQVKMVLLPYKGDKLSMLIVVPQKRHSLDEVESQLRLETLDSWVNSLALQKKVRVTLPRFTAHANLSLVEPLTSLGLRKAFTQSAEFSGMNGKNDLFLSEVIHEALVAVDEEGTVAAAATAAVIQQKSMPQIFELVADQPFLFMIRDNSSGSTLFMGRVTDPSF